MGKWTGKGRCDREKSARRDGGVEESCCVNNEMYYVCSCQ